MRRGTCLLFVIVLGCAACDRAKSPKAVASGSDMAVGKLLIQPPAETSAVSLEDFYTRQIQVLMSKELHDQAGSAVHKSHADWKPDEVSIQAAHLRGGQLVTVVGRGPIPECSRAVVDALMTEYVASTRAEGTDAAPAASKDRSAEDELKEAEMAWNSFKLAHDPGSLDSKLASAQRRVKQLTVAREFFEKQVNAVSLGDLQQDIEHRQSFDIVPPGIPEEFMVVSHHAPTANELAYLSALRQTNTAAIEAAKQAALGDAQSRLEAQKRELGIVNELAGNAKAELEKFQNLRAESQKLGERLSVAEERYKSAKSAEKNAAVPAKGSASSRATASIMERAASVMGTN